jgi:hypothetical protein
MTNGKLRELIENGLINFDLEDFKKVATLSDEVVNELFNKENDSKREIVFELVNSDDFINDNYNYIVSKINQLPLSFDFNKLLFYAKNRRLQKSKYYKEIIENLILVDLDDEFISNLISKKEFYSHPCFDLILKIYSSTEYKSLNVFNHMFLNRLEYFKELMSNIDLASNGDLFEVVFSRFLVFASSENFMELDNFKVLISKLAQIKDYRNANFIMDILSLNIGNLYLDEIIDIQDYRQLELISRALRDISYINHLRDNEVFIRKIIQFIKNEDRAVYYIIEVLVSCTHDNYDLLAARVYSLLEAGYTDRNRFMIEFKKLPDFENFSVYYSLLDKQFRIDKDEMKKSWYDFLLKSNPNDEVAVEIFESNLRLLKRP